MGRYEEISIEEIIAGVKPQLRLSNTTEHDDWFELLSYEAIRHLDSLSIFQKRQCSLDVVDKKAKLPAGFQKLLALRFLASDANTVTVGLAAFSNFLYVDTHFLKDNGQSTNLPLIRGLSTFVQISKGFLFFSSEADEIQSVEIAFMGLNLNEDGRPVIYADYERALKAYICWKFTLAYSENYKVSDLYTYQKEWQGQRAKIKGADFKNSFDLNKRKMHEIANAIITSRLENSISSQGY